MSTEIKALEEISKLCGDKIVRVGKDKKEETRPLVTISELQRMKPDEYVLVRHRCPPYKGKLKMDYNSDFGFGIGNEIYGKDVVYPQREMGEVSVFSVKDFVREKKQASSPNPMGGSPGFPGGLSGMPSPFGSTQSNGGATSNSLFGGEQDIDEIIKNIDKQIAALEAEEKANKEKEKQEVKTEKNEQPIIEEPKNETQETVEEKPIDIQVIKESDLTDKKDELETKPVEKISENAPNVSEVIHSNMVNLDNFTIKNNNELDNQQPTTESSTTDDSYDDFFDDFFDE